MDLNLRVLKRAAENDPSYWPAYAHALERALGGVEKFIKLQGDNYNIFTESYIADAFYFDAYGIGPARVGAYEITGPGSLQCIAWMITVDWQDSFDEDDAKEVEEWLSDEFKELLEVAKNHGYEYILLWLP